LSRGPAGARLVRQLAPLVSLRVGLRWYSACRSRPFLERACHADQLVLGSSGSSRHWSRSALVFAVCACCKILRCVRLLHNSVPWWLVCRSRTALVSAAHFLSAAQSPARTNSTGIRLLLSVPHSWSFSFDCPASQVKTRPKCDRITPSHPLSWPCVSDLLTPI
jgi:hypothetical protein